MCWYNSPQPTAYRVFEDLMKTSRRGTQQNKKKGTINRRTKWKDTLFEMTLWDAERCIIHNSFSLMARDKREWQIHWHYNFPFSHYNYWDETLDGGSALLPPTCGSLMVWNEKRTYEIFAVSRRKGVPYLTEKCVNEIICDGRSSSRIKKQIKKIVY